MLNPEYECNVYREEPARGEAGPVLRCPKCTKILGEGHVLLFVTRCKSCGHWVRFKKRRKDEKL